MSIFRLEGLGSNMIPSTGCSAFWGLQTRGKCTKLDIIISNQVLCRKSESVLVVVSCMFGSERQHQNDIGERSKHVTS